MQKHSDVHGAGFFVFAPDRQNGTKNRATPERFE